MRKVLRILLLTVTVTALFTSFITCGAVHMKVPILMYHSITNDPNDNNDMKVTGERFRLDMEFLQQFGYTALLPADLIEIKNGSKELPEKPVMITFDDGYRSNYDIAYPILQKTGMRAAVSVIAHNMRNEDDTDETRTSLTWGEIREMADSGVFEIGSHTYNLHNPQNEGMGIPGGVNGVQRLKGESHSQFAVRVGTDLQTSVEMIRRHTGKAVNYFCYPYGAYDYWVPPILDDLGVQVSMLTNKAVADLKNGLHSLPRCGVTMRTPLSALLRQKDTARPNAAKVLVNDTEATLQAYEIDGNNYVRVRDVAVLLAGTESGFDVQWDQAQHCVTLQTKAKYEPLGTENGALPEGGQTVQSIVEPTVVDGTPVMTAAYNVDGHTYYKLRSLGALCGFQVDWDAENFTVLITA